MRYLTTRQAAEIIGEHPETTARRCANGQIPAVKVGRWRIAEDDLTAFLRPGKRGPVQPERLSARQKRKAARA